MVASNDHDGPAGSRRRDSEAIALRPGPRALGRRPQRAPVADSSASRSAGAARVGTRDRGRRRRRLPVRCGTRPGLPRSGRRRRARARRGGSRSRASTTAVQAASSWAAGAGERRPATRYGCSTSATVRPVSSATSRAVTRSGASTPPPAPCPSTSAALGLRAAWRCARARPCGVSISTTVGAMCLTLRSQRWSGSTSSSSERGRPVRRPRSTSRAAGARVLLADKARFPRDKPCGGGLTGRALKHAAVRRRAGRRARRRPHGRAGRVRGKLGRAERPSR